MKLVADELKDYKHLRGEVQFLDELPHTNTGKITKKKLKEMTKDNDNADENVSVYPLTWHTNINICVLPRKEWQKN